MFTINVAIYLTFLSICDETILNTIICVQFWGLLLLISENNTTTTETTTTRIQKSTFSTEGSITYQIPDAARQAK